MSRLLLVCLVVATVIGIANAVTAQENGAVISREAQLDSVVVRQPNQQDVASFLAEDRFDYGTDVRSGQSFFARLVRQFFDGLARVQDVAGPLWDIGVWIVLAVIVVFAIIRMLGADFSGAVYAARTGTGPTATVTDGTTVDYAERLRDAEGSGDLRSALRWRYLLFLDRLNEMGLISWRREKTNWMYAGEIQDPGVRSAFREITHWYERSWYGAWTLPESDYERIVGKLAQALGDLKPESPGAG